MQALLETDRHCREYWALDRRTANRRARDGEKQKVTFPSTVFYVTVASHTRLFRFFFVIVAISLLFYKAFSTFSFTLAS